jgi:hypothetical protein
MDKNIPIDDAHRATQPMLEGDPDLQKWLRHFWSRDIQATIKPWGSYAVDYDGTARHTNRQGYAVFREFSDAEMKKAKEEPC